ncbi:MAG: hypothetical protein G8345_05265 [Magnetococcales bacterium]|nr:hypothetical protein [Magnetococcales bacterium]NGZ26278.1 hypothetical protein [Magnetococcales bacterium]
MDIPLNRRQFMFLLLLASLVEFPSIEGGQQEIPLSQADFHAPHPWLG